MEENGKLFVSSVYLIPVREGEEGRKWRGRRERVKMGGGRKVKEISYVYSFNDDVKNNIILDHAMSYYTKFHCFTFSPNVTCKVLS